jgi:hypothetical protein
MQNQQRSCSSDFLPVQTVVDFVSVRSPQIHKLHQVPSRNQLILKEKNWVGNLVPNRVPEPIESC